MPNLLESFDKPILDSQSWAQLQNTGWHATHGSGSGVLNAEPPDCWAEVSYDYWNEEANKVLKSPSVSALKNQWLPASEPGLRILNEGDVVHAATLYLTHPIHMALGVYYNENILFAAEATLQDARADKVYKTANTEWHNATFAVLEYKAPGTIIQSEFDDAKLTAQTDVLWVAHPPESRFIDNSKKLMKQAVHYADAYGTRFVALCDLSTLVLVYMEDIEGKTGGIRCLATVIKSKTQMRRALLGFLSKAYLTKIDPATEPPKCRRTFVIAPGGGTASDGRRPTTRSVTRALTQQTEPYGSSALSPGTLPLMAVSQTPYGLTESLPLRPLGDTQVQYSSTLSVANQSAGYYDEPYSTVTEAEDSYEDDYNQQQADYDTAAYYDVDGLAGAPGPSNTSDSMSRERERSRGKATSRGKESSSSKDRKEKEKKAKEKEKKEKEKKENEKKEKEKKEKREKEKKEKDKKGKDKGHK